MSLKLTVLKQIFIEKQVSLTNFTTDLPDIHTNFESSFQK